MTPFDPKWPKMKFDTANVFISSNYTNDEVFMTHAYMSHRKRIFWSKFKIWPQLTPFDLAVLRPSMHPKLMSNEQIGIKKSLKNGHVWPVNCAQISILQVDFLEILNNSRTRNENSDIFFDPKEPEYNIFWRIHFIKISPRLLMTSYFAKKIKYFFSHHQ